MFDHPVNRENRNVVVNLLQDLNMPIIAVWLVARPINRQMSGPFEHWCVKVQARGCLISIDFLESDGKGAFGLQQRTDVGAELSDFMYYSILNPETRNKTKHKWEIISSVTPHPFRNVKYLNYLSDFDRLRLEEYIRNAKIAPKDPNKFMKDIKCKKRVCDIAEFAALWTVDEIGYNPITKNCQVCNQFMLYIYVMIFFNYVMLLYYISNLPLNYMLLVGPNYKEEIEKYLIDTRVHLIRENGENRTGFREKVAYFQKKEEKLPSLSSQSPSLSSESSASASHQHPRVQETEN